jgi:ribosomal protein L4
VTHGPSNERIYDKKINKKMKTKALYTILSQKLRDGEVLFVDDLGLSTIIIMTGS